LTSQDNQADAEKLLDLPTYQAVKTLPAVVQSGHHQNFECWIVVSLMAAIVLSS